MINNDVTLTVPRTWHPRRNVRHGIVLAARPPTVPAGGVSPEIVLRCAPVDAELATWRGQALLDLRGQLVDFALEDADDYDLGDHRVAYSRFAHRLGAADVLCDQWAGGRRSRRHPHLHRRPRGLPDLLRPVRGRRGDPSRSSPGTAERRRLNPAG